MIAEFYEDSEVFITGGSGVVGKALIEKLLRSCNVRRIYLLMRPKKNVNIEDRLKKIKKAMVRKNTLLNSCLLTMDVMTCHRHFDMKEIFRRLHREKPNEFDEKISLVPGDVTDPNLGITKEYAKLLENVTVMFHSAATVRFDESLKDALTLNVAGTLKTLQFAETLKKLKVFMYVSTFFSNPYLKKVEPKMYTSPMDWKFCLDLIERDDIPEEMLDTITRKLITGFPNTYCFTKNLAESLVNDFRDKIPVAIFRPSIVVFAIEDPEPGYAPALFGAMGLFALAGAGVLKSLFIAKDHRLDLSPQDLCIKSLLYDAMKAANIYAAGKPPEIPVYLVSSNTHTTITFRGYCRITEKYRFWIKYAYDKNFLIPGVICTDNRLLYQTVVLVKQVLPSLIIDGLLKLCGRQPELMRLQRKVYITLESMTPFLFNSYDSPGVTHVDEMMINQNGTDFNVDPLKHTLNYYMNISYIKDMVQSIREVLLKEDPTTLPRARRIMLFKIYLYRLIQICVAYKVIEKTLPMVTNWLNLKMGHCDITTNDDKDYKINK